MGIENRKIKDHLNTYGTLLIPSVLVGLLMPILLLHFIDPQGFEGLFTVGKNASGAAYAIFALKVVGFCATELVAALLGMLSAAVIYCRYNRKRSRLSDDDLKRIINYPSRNSGRIGDWLMTLYDKAIF